MAVNEDMAALLELLACPACGGTLKMDGETLRCTTSDHTFEQRGNVPVLLTGSEADDRPSLLGRLQFAILGNPRLYDFHQRHAGGRPIAAQVKAALGELGPSTVLDVGAGTGMVSTLVSPETRYVWLDNDVLKLRGFVSKSIDCMAVLGDAARLPFAEKTADVTVMVEVSHHLPNAVLRTCLEEVGRVTRDRFVFVDAVRGRRLRSKLLWQLDLGRFPRTEAELVDALGATFEIQKLSRFRVNHDHVVCTCVPTR